MQQSPQDQATAHRAAAETKDTVGYGDKYPLPTEETHHITIKNNNDLSGLSHINEERTYGYDNIKFGHNRVPFLRFLDAINLDPAEDYIRIFRDLNRNNSYSSGTNEKRDFFYLHCWVNSEIMYVSTTNPITGVQNGNYYTTGEAEYSGLSGVAKPVEKAHNTLLETAEWMKDFRQSRILF